MIIETNRLFLREMNMDDYDVLYAVLSDSVIMRHYPHTFDEARVRNWIYRNIERYRVFGFGLWAVCLREDGRMIGDCGLTIQNVDGAFLPEIGYHIARVYQRRGYAKEAARAVRDWTFEHTPFGMVYSYMKKDNIASAAAARCRRRMGAVVEAPAIYQDMTAAENIRQQYKILGAPSDDGIDALLRLVGLSNTGKKRARNFSLGMRRRLGVAVALAGNPDFLVLDEPVNGPDPQGIVEMRELILKLNRERGVTILISSHILDELSRFAAHYGFIDGGRMVQKISAAELEARCRRCVRLEVNDVRALARTLDAMRVEYRIADDMHADVNGGVSITDLVSALSKQGCAVIDLRQQDETLENFYMNLVGGERHA